MNLFQHKFSSRINIAGNLFVAGISVMAIGLSLGMFIMSVSQFIMAGAWLLRGDYLPRIKIFLKNKIALSFTLIFLLHAVGMLWTTDYDYGIKDLRIKFPILIMPFMFSTMDTLNRKQFLYVLKIFVLSVLASSAVSLTAYFGYSWKPQNDIRDVSVFISHIRLSLLVCLCIYACAWFMYDSKKVAERILIAALVVWFIAFLILLEAFTGLIILAITSGLIIFYLLIKQKKYAFVSLLLFINILGFFYVYKTAVPLYQGLTIAKPLNIDSLATKTSRGNYYDHKIDYHTLENGNIVSIYLCFPELKEAWNLRSKIDFEGSDEKGNRLLFTIVRYMTSKGLRKDYDGVMALSDADIRNIEKGIPSINRVNNGPLAGRLYEIIWEYNNYKKTKDANASSVMQRFEYWKASYLIIKQNLFFGVGTGDNELEFSSYYDESKSNLRKEWRLRSHNQFLAIGVSFGIIGLLIFLLCLFYPASQLSIFSKTALLANENLTTYFYVTFFITAILSFINEDTLETQAGVSFFIFFSCLFLFSNTSIEKSTKMN